MLSRSSDSTHSTIETTASGQLHRVAGLGKLATEHRGLVRPKSNPHPQGLPKANGVLQKEPIAHRAFEELVAAGQRKLARNRESGMDYMARFARLAARWPNAKRLRYAFDDEHGQGER
jgi:hypothetical protein